MAEETERTGHAIADHLFRVRENIRAACARSGRRVEDVTLIAVSKKKPFEDIMDAQAAGVTQFGENYVQELMEKIECNRSSGSNLPISWHMIGHLQKNKVKYLIGQTALIHSVDSVSLAQQIEKEAGKQDRIMRVLLEVNVAGEENKWGFDLASVQEAAREIIALPHVRVLGLMTSAPLTDNPESNRLYFRTLRECAEALASENLLYLSDPDFHAPVLSMGMTGDYQVAIEEGATMVRVGTGIFGKRES